MHYNTNNPWIIVIIQPIMQYNTHNLWIMSIIHGFMDKIQFQTKNFSEFCEDSRGAHQFFFKSADYKPKPKIIHICLSTSKETNIKIFLDS